ncbi:MAG TPA: DNA ligase D [Sphingomonadaceae bacterium]|nr:DNA ligase D [Sphingomonadaceae bacterium]
MKKDLSLDAYNAKRDFTKTNEPPGLAAALGGSTFIVQKHDATRLHYDFRLELDGVLKSWAVTRGPSLDPDDKRLAVRTEDHPLSYATFEGVIPKGEYGGGTVMLWDRGTWIPHPGKDPRKTLDEGHLHFTLEGERMKGEWIMIRLKPRAGEKNENWLLRKIADDHAGASDTLVERELTSIATGRTMAEIAAGVEVETPSSSRRKPGPKNAKSDSEAKSSSSVAKTTVTLGPGVRRDDGKRPKKADRLPEFQPPQLATLADHVPAGGEYIHETKYDGYRILLAVGGGEARTYTRTGQDWSDRFRAVADAGLKLPGSALIDGEVVVLDAEGRPNFQALQASIKEGGGNLAFFGFDILEQDGEKLVDLPNIERKGRLAALFANAEPPIHYAEHVVGSGEAMFEAMCRGGMEGIISKRADAAYRGKRTQAWLKVKCIRRQEFVIVGWTPSENGRGFRSLLLGLNEGGELRYAGKAGTGFDMAGIDALLEKMTPLERAEPTVKAPRAAVRGARWIAPKLVAEVAFTEWTADGVLRHPSFIALREDKPAADVVRERETHVAATPGAGGAAATGVKLTSGDRVIFPEDGITKAQLADYYAAVAGPMLEWTAKRPISLVRCPQGRAKHCFFQKHDAGSFGDLVKQVAITESKGGTENYLYVEDAAGLIACVQMGTIEFHGWGSKVDALEKPDRLVFDLDPDEGLGFDAVKAAAVKLRALLADMGLVTFPLLSGGKGLHVVAPLDETAEWPEVKDFANRFSRALAAAEPEYFTANIRKVERKGRIFLDWLRNQRGATAIMPYSARARPGATVAAPIAWDELDGMKGADFGIGDLEALLERAGSKALRGWGEAEQALPKF